MDTDKLLPEETVGLALADRFLGGIAIQPKVTPPSWDGIVSQFAQRWRPFRRFSAAANTWYGCFTVSCL
jgi:hypothetical protein